MTSKKTDDEEANDLVIEIETAKLERPKKLDSLIDTQAMHFLEAMDFQSYDDLSGTLERFMMDAPLFQGDVSFGRAAMALDLTSQLFSTMDTDGNHLVSREEFAYLLLKTTEANRMALSWLIENFNAFTQACFFQDQISKDDIEASRNVFHGLKVAQEKFGFDKQPTVANLQYLNEDQIKDYLYNHGSNLTPQEAAGLAYLLEHIKKYGQRPGKPEDAGDADKKAEDKAKKEIKEKEDEKEEKTEKADGKDSASKKSLRGLEGILDPRTLATLRALKLNSFESLLLAFSGFHEDPDAFNGDSPFAKGSNAFDASANAASQLDMGEDHTFTREEFLIISKLTSSKDKKQLGWFATHFDAFTKAFFWTSKPKKKDILGARNLFHGLGFVQENFAVEISASDEQALRQKVRAHLVNNAAKLEAKNKAGLEQLVLFMEKHAQQA